MAKIRKESGSDTNKLIAMGGLLAISIGLFYYFSEASFLLRVVGVTVAFTASAGIFFTTNRGKGRC